MGPAAAAGVVAVTAHWWAMAGPLIEAGVICSVLGLMMWAPWQHPQHARPRRSRRAAAAQAPGRWRRRREDAFWPVSPGGVAASALPSPGGEEFPGEWSPGDLRDLHDAASASPPGWDGEEGAAMVAGETPAPPREKAHETAAPGRSPSPPPPGVNGWGPGGLPPGKEMYCMRDQQDCLPGRPCSCCALQESQFPCGGECGDPYPHTFCPPPPPVSDDTQEWLNTLAGPVPEQERDKSNE